jgi:hypothetical protein
MRPRRRRAIAWSSSQHPHHTGDDQCGDDGGYTQVAKTASAASRITASGGSNAVGRYFRALDPSVIMVILCMSL